MSDYDALRKVINHEANQDDDDGGFFAKLGGLEPDPEDDGPTARGLFQHLGPGETAKLGRRLDDALAQYQPRPAWASKGGHIPCQPLPVRLKDGERVWAKEGDQIVEYEHQVDNFGEQWRLRKTGRTTKRKRKLIVKLRKEHALFWRAFGYRWQWKCTVCHRVERDTTWEETYEWATRHARQHESR